MITRLTLAALSCAAILAAAGDAPATAQGTTTQRLDFTAGGVLRLEHSAGDVQITGEDRQDVEITTTRYIQGAAVTAARHDNDIVVSTAFPHYHWYALFSTDRPIELTYVIKVPRKARLAITHGDGEIHIAEVTGDIHATVRQGLISLSLAPDPAPDIDARCRMGNVISDFSGLEHTRFWFFNHRFTDQPSGASQKLYLRTGFGDIVLLKTR